MGRLVGTVLALIVAMSCVVGTADAASGRPPVVGPVPEFSTRLGLPDGQVLLIPGTGDPTGMDQVARTYRWWGDRPTSVIAYPTAFGIAVGPFGIGIIGSGTYDSSEAAGVRATERAARAAIAARRPLIINGFSQGASIAMRTARRLIRSGQLRPRDVVVVLGADPRFPGTGLDAIAPNVLPGVTTRGPRDPEQLPGTKVISYCIRGDAVCGLANPIADPLAAAVYLGPGYYLHAFMYPKVGQYRQIKTWRAGSTEYHVYDGGNPIGIMLRDIGIPVDKKFDDAVSGAVPVPMPGSIATRGGRPVPTPRQLQQRTKRTHHPLRVVTPRMGL